MLENLKLAVRKQKRLIIIFCLTIFIPSISLSIFGIRAIRNERFRLAKQIENEHRRAAENLKLRIDSQFEELSSILQNLARSDAFLQRDDAGIKNLFDAILVENPLVEQVFVAFEGEEPFFPLFQPGPSRSLFSSVLGSGGVLQERLGRAKTSEFKERNYKSAVSLYRNIFDQSKDTNFKSRMLANISRCLMKAEDYEGAIRDYQRICEDYPESYSSSGLPWALISQLQMAGCYLKLGQLQTSLQTSLNLYRDILHMRWPLGEAQFKTYASLTEDAIDENLSKNQPSLALTDYKEAFNQLKSLHRERIEQWMVINDIKQEIFPELLLACWVSRSGSNT
jgi:tetratricopeptide (TPR) repeat protein